jgi:prevent-host-death family protein
VNGPGDFDILVSMTRITVSPKSRKSAAPKSSPGQWALQDAKARFSELVRKVRSEGPQHVTVHGRDEVVVIAAEEFRRLKGENSGQALVEAIQASPHREIELAPERRVMPVRSVTL